MYMSQLSKQAWWFPFAAVRLFGVLKRKINPLSLLERGKGTLPLKTEEWKTPTALSAAISMADKHPYETFSSLSKMSVSVT